MPDRSEAPLSTASGSDRAGPGSPPAGLRDRELRVAREISESFLTATTPLEVYRHALDRVTPLVHASFASVFLRDSEEPRLLRLVCAHNWPQASARYLSDLRIREGRGPTGLAVERNAPVEVEDIFDDPALQEWWEPARELSFLSMIALPLAIEERTLGALSFYFGERQRFGEEDRALLGVVAHQLAMTAERAELVAELRSSSERVERGNDALLRRMGDAEEALEIVKRRRDAGPDFRGSRSGPERESR